MGLLEKRLRKGDINALEEVYNLYFSKVYGLALKMTKDEGTARDVVQDVFLKLWNRRKNLVEDLPVDQQLFVMTKSKVLDFFRKKVREEQAVYEYSTLHASENLSSQQKEKRLQRIYQLIEELPQRQREIFRMVRFEGLTYDEIARRLNISKHTVSNHFSAAQKFLREHGKHVE